MPEPFADGFLHIPVEPDNTGLVLTHGAGTNCQTPLLIAVANAFADRGTHVLRVDLAFRRRRATGPPHPSQAADDRNGLRDALVSLGKKVTGNLFLGGHSYGGRQASILAALDPGLARALLLLSYPLHPPAKPLQLRTAHFPDLTTPALFLQGVKDDFGSEGELQTALALIPARTCLSLLPAAGHDLKRGKFDLDRYLLAPWTALNLPRA